MQSQYTALLEKLLSEASVTETGKGIPATSMHSLKQDLLLKEHAAGIARHRVLQLKSKLHRLQDLRQEVNNSSVSIAGFLLLQSISTAAM